MQYKIEATSEQIEYLSTHVFNDYVQEIKNNILHVITGGMDYELTYLFFSMVRVVTNCPVSVDYMTRDLIKFVVFSPTPAVKGMGIKLTN